MKGTQQKWPTLRDWPSCTSIAAGLEALASPKTRAASSDLNSNACHSASPLLRPIAVIWFPTT